MSYYAERKCTRYHSLGNKILSHVNEAISYLTVFLVDIIFQKRYQYLHFLSVSSRSIQRHNTITEEMS